jgi:hypothetical protein
MTGIVFALSFPTQLIRNYAEHLACFPEHRAHDSSGTYLSSIYSVYVAAFAYHKINAKVVNSIMAGLNFACFPKLWLPIETVSR